MKLRYSVNSVKDRVTIKVVTCIGSEVSLGYPRWSRVIDFAKWKPAGFILLKPMVYIFRLQKANTCRRKIK